jgi:hypothetical protein
MNTLLKFASFTAALILSGQASANTLVLSDFFQDWQLNVDKTSQSCSVYVSAEPGNDVPGSNGMPKASYDSTDSIRFLNRQSGSFTLLKLGKNPSSDTDGDVIVTLEGNNLKVVDYKNFFGFSKVYRQDTYTLLPDGSLVISSTDRKTKTQCTYTNLHLGMVGKVEVGASLFVQGKKISQCSFVPASPRLDQVNFNYNERCSFGKFTHLIVIDENKSEVVSEIFQNPKAPHDLEIVRSTKKLNGGTENFVSFDDEIAVQDSKVDDILPNNSEYYLSPYKANVYKFNGTTAYIQIEYAAAP